MRIKLDDKHYLNSDAYCYWLTSETVSEKTGKLTERRVSGYFDDIEDVLASFTRRFIRNSEATEIGELLKEAHELDKTIHDLVKGLNKALKELDVG